MKPLAECQTIVEIISWAEQHIAHFTKFIHLRPMNPQERAEFSQATEGDLFSAFLDRFGEISSSDSDLSEEGRALLIKGAQAQSYFEDSKDINSPSIKH